VLLTEGNGVYTVDEFASLINKTDRSNVSEFRKYQAASSQLFHLITISRWVSALIREYVLRIQVAISCATLSCMGDAASKLMVAERLSHGIYDPWESEDFLREQAGTLRESLLGSKADVAEIYTNLSDFIRMHLAIKEAMASLAEIMQLPEIASTPNNPMVYVKELNKSLAKLESPYCDIFSEIDVSSLEPSQADIDEWVTRVSCFVSSRTT
jgi:hypothetical protein